MHLTDQAARNLEALRANPYPGRGIIIGMTSDGRMTIVYWIMGRSDDSRNRVFEQDGAGRVFTAIADPNKLKPGTNTRLIVYNAMREGFGAHVVSNGDQTDRIMCGLATGEPFQQSLLSCFYEPDGPNWTSRISGILWPATERCETEIGVLHKADWGNTCLRSFHQFPQLPTGFGLGVTTYEGDGNPLPKFRGEPRAYSIVGRTSEQIANHFWEVLNPGNRVSIAVKSIPVGGSKTPTQAFIINKYPRVA